LAAPIVPINNLSRCLNNYWEKYKFGISMMRRLLYGFLAAALLAGCANPTAQEAVITSRPKEVQPVPWTSLNFNNTPDRFQFAIVGDRTGRHRVGVFEKGIDKLNLLQPEFVVSVGDLIEGYTKDEAEIDEQWNEIEGFISKLQAPFFYTPGNHDLSNPLQARKWAERFGQAYYHFVYRDVLFLIINTSDPQSSLSSQQIAYIAKALKENANVRWTVVLMHEPLWDYKTPTNWEQVEKLLLDRPYTVFAGHTHTYTKYVRHDRRYIVLATMGGGMKGNLRGAEMGKFDHVTWVTMMPDGPRVANIELDAIHDEDICTEAQAAVINRVKSGNILQVSPVLLAQDQFERAAASLTFKNEGDVALTAAGTIPASAGLRAAPDKFEVTIPPGQSAKVALELLAEKPTAIDALPPLAIQWTANAQLPHDKPVRVPTEDVLAVDRLHGCPARSTPVTLDGKLDDWPGLPHAWKPTKVSMPEHWKGESDCSYRFGTAHDDKFVYIAVKVTDDKSVLNSLKEPWSQDGIEIRLDARPDPERSLGRGRGEMKEILVVSMSAAAKPGEPMVLYSAKDLPAGVKAVCVKTDTGYAAEVAVPVSYMNEKQGAQWKAFRLDVTVDDYDQVAGPLRALWWRPDWRSGETFAGSGTFQKN
jgi:hypothetical protein